MRRPLACALILSGLALGGCHQGGRREITPTTLGTDLEQMPRGKMTPFPWPGQSIARKSPAPPVGDRKLDPETAQASSEPVAR